MSRPGPMPHGTLRHRRLANLALLVAAVAVIAIVPIALGGNRAIIWTLATALLAALAALHSAWMAWTGEPAKFSARAIALLAVPYAAFLGWGLVQILPLPLPGLPDASQYGLDPGWARISLSPTDTLFGLVRWAGYGLLFIIILGACVQTPRTRIVLDVIFWTIFAHAAWGLVALHALGDPILFMTKWAYQGDATGGFVNRNSFATFLAIGAAIGTSRLLCTADRPSDGRRPTGRAASGEIAFRITLVAGLAVILVALVSTHSRMGLASGLAGMAASAAICLLGQRRTTPWKSLALSLVAALLLALFVLLFASPLGERFASADQDLAARTDLYRQVLGLIAERPLAGHGLDSFADIYPHVQAPPVALDMVWDKAHNTYLELWSDMGILAGSLPLLMVAFIAFRIASALRRTARPDPVLAAAAGAIVVAGLHSLTDFSLEIAGVAALFTGLLALAVARIMTLQGGRL